MAHTAAHPRTRLCGQEDHPGCADRPDVPAAAPDHVRHHSPQEVSPPFLDRAGPDGSSLVSGQRPRRELSVLLLMGGGSTSTDHSIIDQSLRQQGATVAGKNFTVGERER